MHTVIQPDFNGISEYLISKIRYIFLYFFIFNLQYVYLIFIQYYLSRWYHRLNKEIWYIYIYLYIFPFCLYSYIFLLYVNFPQYSIILLLKYLDMRVRCITILLPSFNIYSNSSSSTATKTNMLLNYILYIKRIRIHELIHLGVIVY